MDAGFSGCRSGASTARRAALALLLGVAIALLTPRSRAAPTTPSLALEAAPTLGSATPIADGWFGVSVRLSNPGDARVAGTLEVTSEVSWSHDKTHVVTRAPFALAGKGRVTVALPVHGFVTSVPSLTVRAIADDGTVLATAGLAEPRNTEPLLFDFDVPSRILPALRNVGVPVARATTARGAYGTPQLTVSTPQVNPATGDPVLPVRAPDYASVTVVLARSEALAKLAGPELDALGGWVMAGGALAVVVTRPEDLRGPVLTALTGGAIHETPPPTDLIRERDFLVAPDSSATPSYSYPTPSMKRRLASPGTGIADKLVGYAGGNLQPSPWGASASYGLGEVHLLGFDATREPFVSDDWVQREVVDLVRHAWERDSAVALPLGKTALDASGTSEIRKQLDPNEGSRWAIAVAALLLLVYAVVAGPINFHLAAKHGTPLRALRRLPLWAAGALAGVVLLGALAKGIRGRARHLVLVEAGAGMPRGAATRFRGFYTSSSSELTVRATERDSVLDVAGETDDADREIVVDRDGARIDKLRAKPWQTLVVREDGFSNLGGGVSLVERPDGQIAVKNRIARDLVGVLLRLPSGEMVAFPRVADGALVLSGAGKRVSRVVGGATVSGGAATHRLDSALFTEYVEPAAPGVGAAWGAFEQLADSDTDWWPVDVPVLLAQIDGGDGRTSDSGLRVDRDRVLIRVVGFGGVP